MRTDKEMEQYISGHTTSEDPLLTELDRATHLGVIHPRMISGHVQGRVMEMISRMIRPRYILEIGTFTGYSAICLAKGLEPGGELHTFEVNDELAVISDRFFERAQIRGKIIPHIGSALDKAPELGLIFDLVFIDGDKREYNAYYDMLLDGKLVKSGSYILADNVLWYGKVVDKPERKDKQTPEILRFNDRVQADPRVENVILPVRDGMTLIRVI